MRRGLIGDGIGPQAKLVELRELFGRIPLIADRDGLRRGLSASIDLAQRLLARIGDAVEVAQLSPTLQACAIDVDD